MKRVFRLGALMASGALLSACGTVAEVAEAVSANQVLRGNILFVCTVESARDLLSHDPLNVAPASGPIANYSKFELDTASGELKWMHADGSLGTRERYSIVQEGTTFRNWAAVKQIAFAGNRLVSQLSSATNAFIRIRPWDLPGYEDDRGRFFMVTNGDDVVTGHCVPSGTASAVTASVLSPPSTVFD
nr:MAG: hypothetical protein E4H34_05145 [Hyphomicrobiales bacterium]